MGSRPRAQDQPTPGSATEIWIPASAGMTAADPSLGPRYPGRAHAYAMDPARIRDLSCLIGTHKHETGEFHWIQYADPGA